MTLVIDPPGYYLWDWSGVEGLEVAQQIFGQRVSQLAPLQSVETSFNAHTCSVLRLTESSFRVALSRDHGLDLAIEDLNLHVQVQQCNPFQAPSTSPQVPLGCDRTATLVLSERLGIACLHRLATPHPLYSLENLPLHCAVPAHIGQTALLVWHHFWLGSPRFDLHTPQADVQTIAQAITVEIESPHPLTDTGRGTTAATRGYHPPL